MLSLNPSPPLKPPFRIRHATRPRNSSKIEIRNYIRRTARARLSLAGGPEVLLKLQGLLCEHCQFRGLLEGCLDRQGGPRQKKERED